MRVMIHLIECCLSLSKEKCIDQDSKAIPYPYPYVPIIGPLDTCVVHYLKFNFRRWGGKNWLIVIPSGIRFIHLHFFHNLSYKALETFAYFMRKNWRRQEASSLSPFCYARGMNYWMVPLCAYFDLYLTTTLYSLIYRRWIHYRPII